MRKSYISIFILLIVLLIFSCSKEDSPGPLPLSYFIEGNFNGQLIRYEISPIGTIDNNYCLGLALESASENPASFSFTVEGLENIVEKSYREVDHETNIIFNYDLSELEHYHSQMGDEEDFVITITKIGDGYFSGTFSGTLRHIDEPYEILNVANGKFVLQME